MFAFSVSFVKRKFNVMLGVAMETPFRAFLDNRYLNTLNCNRTEHWFTSGVSAVSSKPPCQADAAVPV